MIACMEHDTLPGGYPYGPQAKRLLGLSQKPFNKLSLFETSVGLTLSFKH